MPAAYNSGESALVSVAGRAGTRAVKSSGSFAAIGGRPVVAAGIADMDFTNPREVINALRERLDLGPLGYTYADERVPAAIHEWYEHLHQIDVDPACVIRPPFSPRAVVAWLGRVLLEPSDTVVLLTPTYPGLRRMSESSPARVVEWPLAETAEGVSLDLEALDDMLSAARPTVLVVCNPINPTGQCISSDVLSAAVDRLAPSGLRLVIADEVHGDLIHPGKTHGSALRLAVDHDGVVVIGSIGKTFNLSGLRTSHLIVTAAHVRGRLRDALDRCGFYEGGLIDDIVTLAALRDGGAWREEVARTLAANADLAGEILANSDTGLRLVRPDASFLATIDYDTTPIASENLLQGWFAAAGIDVQYGSRFWPRGRRAFRYVLGTSRDVVEQEVAVIVSSVEAITGTLE